MMTRVLAPGALFLIVVASGLAGLPGVSPPSALALDEAERLWTVGSRAFDDGLYGLSARMLGRLIDQFPGDARAGEATLLLGKARLSLGAGQPAIEAFRLAQRLTPVPGRPGEAKFWEGEALFRMKRFDDARDVYEQVLADRESSAVAPEALYGLAWSNLELKKRDAAIADFRRLLAAYPDHPTAPSAAFYLARTLVDTKRPADAAPVLRSFASKYPGHRLAPDARYLLGQALLASGETRDGLAELRGFIQAYPAHELAPQARRLVADTVAKKGTKAEQAEEYKRLLAQSPPSADALYDAGVIASQLGRPRDAEVAWARLRKEFPDHALASRAALELAQAAFARSAFKDASSLAQAAARSGEDAVRGEALVLLGESELRLKRYPTAYQAFQQAIELPGQEAALRFRALAGSGLVMEEQRQWAQAAKYYDEVAARSPDKTLRAWAKERRAAIASKLKTAPDARTAPRSVAPAPRKAPPAETRQGARS
jgi:TolA-binding protein